MSRLSIEIKAKSNNPDQIREILKSKHAEFSGIDRQIDTYFKVNNGRLKLRQGNIENYLIHYLRENKKGPKQSDITLFKNDPKSSLKDILTKALGVSVVVDKKREIYFIGNIKFHIDQVQGLGDFIEIEAIGDSDSDSKDKLLGQCELYLNLFKVEERDLISNSYSDLLLKQYLNKKN